MLIQAINSYYGLELTVEKAKQLIYPLGRGKEEYFWTLVVGNFYDWWTSFFRAWY